jgi:aspartate kinase
MATVVMKFGGTSVANIERIQNVARHVKREADAGNKVAVVVSAMSGVTNQLVAWVKEVSPLYDPREYDAVVATGEQVTAGLLALALQAMGLKARSWTGWQVPIKTDMAHGAARILDVPGGDLKKHLDGGEIAVITGFQGIEPKGDRVATLGRGGSDTFIRMSMVSTPPIPGLFPRHGGLLKSPTKRCLRWRRSGQRFCRLAPSSSQWSTK